MVEVAQSIYGGWMWRVTDHTGGHTISAVAYFTRKGAAHAGKVWLRKTLRAGRWETV